MCSMACKPWVPIPSLERPGPPVMLMDPVDMGFQCRGASNRRCSSCRCNGSQVGASPAFPVAQFSFLHLVQLSSYTSRSSSRLALTWRNQLFLRSCRTVLREDVHNCPRWPSLNHPLFHSSRVMTEGLDISYLIPYSLCFRTCTLAMITALPSLMVKAQPKDCSDSTSLLGEGQFTCVGINLPFCGSLQIFLFVEKFFFEHPCSRCGSRSLRSPIECWAHYHGSRALTRLPPRYNCLWKEYESV
jgi:hypothetical protein